LGSGGGGGKLKIFLFFVLGPKGGRDACAGPLRSVWKDFLMGKTHKAAVSLGVMLPLSGTTEGLEVRQEKIFSVYKKAQNLSHPDQPKHTEGFLSLVLLFVTRRTKVPDKAPGGRVREKRNYDNSPFSRGH